MTDWTLFAPDSPAPDDGAIVWVLWPSGSSGVYRYTTKKPWACPGCPWSHDATGWLVRSNIRPENSICITPRRHPMAWRRAEHLLPAEWMLKNLLEPKS